VIITLNDTATSGEVSRLKHHGYNYLHQWSRFIQMCVSVYNVYHPPGHLSLRGYTDSLVCEYTHYVFFTYTCCVLCVLKTWNSNWQNVTRQVLVPVNLSFFNTNQEGTSSKKLKFSHKTLQRRVFPKKKRFFHKIGIRHLILRHCCLPLLSAVPRDVGRFRFVEYPCRTHLPPHGVDKTCSTHNPRWHWTPYTTIPEHMKDRLQYKHMFRTRSVTRPTRATKGGGLGYTLAVWMSEYMSWTLCLFSGSNPRVAQGHGVCVHRCVRESQCPCAY